MITMENAPPVVEIQLFGPQRVTLRNAPFPRLRSRTSSWLLALLSLRLGREVSREWLATNLWPESEKEPALYNLRRCLADLRQAFGPDADLLQTPTRQTVCLTSEGVWVDAVAFDAAVALGDFDSLEEAVALYRGSLLEGCTEEWTASERVPREQRYLGALQTLAERAVSEDDPASAVRYLRLTVAANPLQEEYQRALMQALADCGDYAAVTHLYRDLRLLLHRDLNAAPAPQTQALYKRLMEQAKRPSSLTALPPDPLPILSRRLPVPVTSLIGREQDVEEVAGWLLKERLVTLVGTGGVGKTRLAIAVAERARNAFADGVWMVELAALTDTEIVPQVVAKTLGIPEQSGSSALETLEAALASRSLLLILDNCEHLLDTCAGLSDRLLSCCPALRLLATSRQPLGITGERSYPVPTLSLPLADSEQEKDLTGLLEFSGVRLFVERSLAVKQEFRLTRQNVGAVCRVCHHLDGIPLAIELAAARMRSLTVEEIEAHLSDRFTLLTGGSRTAAPRHQTLRALIDWSYVQLSEPEKTALIRMSVFAGEWTLEAAEKVCGDGTVKIGNLMASLVDRSLIVHVERAGRSHYAMLESIRQYGAERLRASGEEPRIRTRHRDYYLALAEEAAPQLAGQTQSIWLARLEREHDNLRAALAWSREEEAGAIAQLRMAGALGRFWLARGFITEGRTHLEAALTRTGMETRTAARANALYTSGYLISRQADTAAAKARLEEALAIYRELDHREGIANALNGLGLTICSQGDFTTAIPLFMESLEIQRATGNQGGIATTLNSLGLIAWYQGNYSEAKVRHEESLTIKRRLENRGGIAYSLNNLGLVALSLGDFRTARLRMEESLTIRQELADRWGIADTLNYLGLIAWYQGDYLEAQARHEESLALQQALGNKGGIANSLNNLGLVAAMQGDYPTARALMQNSLSLQQDLDDRFAIARSLEAISLLAARTGALERAARLWGTVEALRITIDSPSPPALKAVFHREVAPLRDRPDGMAVFTAACEEGRKQTLEQAIAYAGEELQM